MSSGTQGEMLRVLVVDDQHLVRRGLRVLLGTLAGVQVVGEAAHGQEALAMVRACAPDVVLSDARMPVMDGVELVTRCHQDHPGLPVLVLTTFDDEDVVHAAIGAGAAGFLLKDSSTDALGEALHAAVSGGLVIDPRVARIAMTTGAGSRPATGGGAGEPGSPLALLTRAERLVAEQVATGATNTEIAATLTLAEGTVKNHVSALLRKLGARDRTALALMLYRALGQLDQ